LFTREAVIKTRLARWAYRIRKVEFIEPFVCLADIFLDLRLARSVKDGCREVQPEYACGPAEMRFKDLSDVHTRRYAERVENYLDRRSVREVRHILLRQDTGDNALVTVASGHLVADRKLTLHRDEDLDHLDN